MCKKQGVSDYIESLSSFRLCKHLRNYDDDFYLVFCGQKVYFKYLVFSNVLFVTLSMGRDCEDDELLKV